MHANCCVYKTMDFAGKRWTLILLLELYKGNGKRRYSELKKSVPDITPKILSARLRELEKHKLVERKIDTKSIPVKCEYSLTPSGKDFIRIIREVKSWGARWGLANEHCKVSSCKSCDY